MQVGNAPGGHPALTHADPHANTGYHPGPLHQPFTHDTAIYSAALTPNTLIPPGVPHPLPRPPAPPPLTHANLTHFHSA